MKVSRDFEGRRKDQLLGASVRSFCEGNGMSEDDVLESLALLREILDRDGYWPPTMGNRFRWRFRPSPKRKSKLGGIIEIFRRRGMKQ